MKRRNKFKLTRVVKVAEELPTPIVNKSIEIVIGGLLKLRASLEEQPHTEFKKSKEKPKSVPSMPETPGRIVRRNPSA